MAQADLAEALEDELFALREGPGTVAYPKAALDYLNDWAANNKGWLRRYYAQGSDEPHFDLTPSTEKAIAWLETRSARSFVGTESRLLTLFELLKQISEGTDCGTLCRQDRDSRPAAGHTLEPAAAPGQAPGGGIPGRHGLDRHPPA